MEKLAHKASALDKHFPKSKSQASRPLIIFMELDYFLTKMTEYLMMYFMNDLSIQEQVKK